MKTPILPVLLLLVLSSFEVFSQEENEKYERDSRHRIGGMIGHTYIPLGYENGKKEGFLVVPTWGLAYDYKLADRWSLGIHMEVENATYVIEQIDGVTLERERPFIIVLAASYKAWKSLIVEAGFGRELESHAEFWVFRVGLGYEIEIGKHWDLAPVLFFDLKEDTYASWTFGLQAARWF